MVKSNIKLAQSIEGLNTIETLERDLHVNRARAIYLLYTLRKSGFVITKRNSTGKRLYYVSPKYALGGTSYLDILNKNTPIKMISSQVHRIYGEEPSIEETLVYFISKKDIRYLISSLALFRKIKNWHKLYYLAKSKNLLREVGALYDVAREVISKVRKMPKRFLNNSLPKKRIPYRYIVDKFKSLDFKDIEQKWKIYIPLSIADLEEYKRR